ncbi:MAG: hypothetical protein Q7R32_06425 [Dehalococcoidia bacterium]|nr:hypothetical protein [Dehalococcoidia bacterium]
MRLFSIADGALKPLRESGVNLEKELQRLCETNLEPLFGLEFVDSEVTIKNFRIDTLAFDPESASFVIIEYKRGSSISVIDQGFSYLALMLNNQAEFVLRYNEKRGKTFGKKDIDWSRSRVYFVASAFTPHQKNAVNFRDLPFDLWEVAVFEKEVLVLNHVDQTDDAASIASVGVDRQIEAVTQVVAKYTMEQHLERRPPNISHLYSQLRQQLLGLADDVTERAISVAILFEKDGEGFAQVIPQQKQIVIHFNSYDGNPRGLHVRDLAAEGKGYYWSVGPYKLTLTSEAELPAVVALLKVSLAGISQGKS